MPQAPLDTYLDLCAQVYDLSKPTSPEDAYAFYRSYASEVQGPILEPMCGTGRFLLPLLEEGFVVHGFDASPYMLEKLRLKAQRMDVKPNVWQAYVEELDRPEIYGLIFIPSGSFGLIIDLDSAQAALTSFYKYLSDQGTLVFEVETLNEASSDFGAWRRDVWVRDDGKSIVANFQALKPLNNVVSTTCKYDLVENEQIICSEVEDFKVRLYDHDQILQMIQRAGFTRIRRCKAFDRFSSPDLTDDVVVYECRK